MQGYKRWKLVLLKGDINEFTPLRNLADEHLQTPKDIVSAGQVITVTITKVKKHHICIDLSLKMEDFCRHPSSVERPKTLLPLDQYFNESAAKSIEMKKNAKQEVHLAKLECTMNNAWNDGNNHEPEESWKGKVSRRACVHTAFRNLRHNEVEKELREGWDELVGEALIWPSSQNCDALALLWVIRKGRIKVIEVLEEEKDTSASIGNVLKIFTHFPVLTFL